ncbi:KGK domain-containing protein [Alkalinema pantanalense CENA528]|uniref:KGK domain-containing protein n=1 Tax=Alkalinema pantanalense TaxID=1620705 RepID=UPI003D6F7773
MSYLLHPDYNHYPHTVMTKPQPIDLSSCNDGVLDFRCYGEHYEMLGDDSFVIRRLLYRIQRRLCLNTTVMHASDSEKIVGEGIQCKLLEPGKSQWVSGKVRLVLEFQPDEPEEPVEAVPNSESQASPLDEIRQTISDQ